jgi:hypothetical protein
LPYEALARDPVAFLDRLEEASGIRLDRRAIGHARANPSFGLATLGLGRLLGLFTARSVVAKQCLISLPGFYELRRHLLNLVARFDRPAGAETILGPAIADRVRRHYAASNQRLAMMRGLDLQALGYPLPADIASARWAPPRGLAQISPVWRTAAQVVAAAAVPYAAIAAAF